MEEIQRRYKDKNTGLSKQVRVLVYTQQEADKENIKYVYWKDATLNDKWILTDDKYVAPLIDIKEYHQKGKKKPSILINTAIGKVWSRQKTLLFEERKRTNTYSYTSTVNWIEKEANKERTKRAIRIYVRQLLMGNVDYNQCGEAYRPDEVIPEATFKRLIKQKRIKKMIDEELDNLLLKVGINKKLALDLLLEAATAARLSGRTKDLLAVSQEIQDLLGIRGNTRSIKETRTLEASTTTINLLEKNKKTTDKIKVTQEINRDKDNAIDTQFNN